MYLLYKYAYLDYDFDTLNNNVKRDCIHFETRQDMIAKLSFEKFNNLKKHGERSILNEF